MFKIKYYIILFFISTLSIINAQPYYYTSNYIPDEVGNHGTGSIFRINMNNPSDIDTILSHVFDMEHVSVDEHGNWLAYIENHHLFIMNSNNINQKNMIAIEGEDLRKFSFAHAINKLVALFNVRFMAIIDPVSLTITDSIPRAIYEDFLVSEDINLSKNGDKMFLIKGDSILLKPKITTYSLLTKQIVSNKFIDEISYAEADDFYFSFRRNGLSVIESLFLTPSPTSYYRIYFLDIDSLSIPIIRDDSQTWADGYVANDGKYLLLFATLLTPDSLDLNPTGKIDIYDMINGELKKTIQLPPDGEVMCFENFPNNVYYAIDIELPTRQVWNLNMDSIFNVLDLTSLNPSTKIVNSPPFTLTVNGHGFDTLSTVYFNDTVKTTAYVNDSVLTASISTSAISVVGNYPVWVTDEWGISDTLMFEVTPQSAMLTAITPSISFPYTLEESLPIFTGTATGTYFSESSVVYFNGLAKTTNYISDSVVTFEVNSLDIPFTGNYQVWVSNNNINSDTLIFSVVTTLPQQITPILECVRRNSSTSYTAYFGYNNYNNADVFIPYGTKNNISSGFSGTSGSTVKIFFTGRRTNVFSINFNGDTITWTLNGTNVTASKKSPVCP